MEKREMLIRLLQLSRRKTLFFVMGVLIALLSVFLLTNSASAANGSSFNAGRIIDDGVFTNKNSMSITDIQLFLNSKVPSCRAGYTCLKDYVENGKSSAQIIWEQSQNYNINPQVIIVTLQKENGLITDTWPEAWQYRTAMGFACPDSGSCDPAFYGFTNQVGQGARHFRNYFDDNPNWFVPYRTGQANIQWSPNSACGSSSVYIQTRGTAALYSYTPYQPNQAALNNLYGSGDSCSAYGNRNFWRDYTDWFGSTYSSEYITQVIQAPNDSRYFLQIGGTKMWIPTSETYYSWKLDSYPVLQVPQSYFDSLATLPNLKQVGRSGPYYYFVSNGEKHYIPTMQHLQLWGFTQQDVDAVPATVVLNNLPEKNYLGRFVKSTNDMSHYVMNGNQVNKIPNDDLLYQWGFIPSQETTVTPEYLATKTTGTDLSRYISSSGSKYVIDTNRKIGSLSTIQSSNWGNPAYVEINNLALGFLPSINYSNFLKPSDDNKWYLLDGGKKRYIPNNNILNTWGYTNNLLTISPNLANLLVPASNASSVVRVVSPTDKTYILDGQKHWVPDGSTLSAWKADPNTIDIYDQASIAQLQDGQNASTLYQIKGTSNIYTNENENVRYIPDGNTLNAWGYPRTASVISLSQSLIYQYPQTAPVSFKVDTGLGRYLLNDGNYYSVPDNLLSQWGFSNPVSIAPATLNRFTTQGSVKIFMKSSGINYVMENGQRIALSGFDDAYGVNSGNTTSLSVNYFPLSSNRASYLVQSSNQADSRVWLLSQGNKYYIDSFARLVNYGFISRQIPITLLAQSTVDSFTDSGKLAPTFFKKTGSGTKMINFGSSAGFPDSNTKTAYGSNASTDEIISASVFDSFPLTIYLQTIAQGYDGKIYLIENGTKRWILNSQLYLSQYASLPKVQLYGTTLEMIPNGASIN